MENPNNSHPNRIPSVNVAIIGATEVGAPVLIKSEGIIDALGAAGVAAMLSSRENTPVVLESKRLDVFYDGRTAERDFLEGIPTELQPGVTYALKGIDDPTSISSRMAHRPAIIKYIKAK